MKTKTSKAQLEVWKWKDRAYELIKDLPEEDQIPFILAQTKDVVEELRRKQAIRAAKKKNQE